MSLHEEMTPVLNAIGQELISATPEHWRAAELTLEIEQRSEETQGIAHLITSPEGHRDLIAPTEELVNATHRLIVLCERYRQPFRGLKFSVTQSEAGAWQFQSDWSYPQG